MAVQPIAESIILDEPTQGIDVGAKLAVYRLMNELTRAGKSIILISSAHNELIAMSDRIAIVKHGRITDIRPAADVTHARPGQRRGNSRTRTRPITTHS